MQQKPSRGTAHRFLSRLSRLPVLRYGMNRFAAACTFIMAAYPAFCDPAEIVAVDATALDGAWRFDVTLRHADTGWDDYADGWRIETVDGGVIAVRELLHPHVEEQPFTRSIGAVRIPRDVHRVFIRARTNVTGWDEPVFEVELDRR